MIYWHYDIIIEKYNESFIISRENVAFQLSSITMQRLIDFVKSKKAKVNQKYHQHNT